jgi:CheY-like chemotaxis protein
MPPDIIFMDITMPVLNGFEATREIRSLEAARTLELGSARTTAAAPCLIIALTGLASGRDQAEAFTSGIDLYMTKPVSFKEVGRLLDNWTANGGASVSDDLPHGPVSREVEGTGSLGQQTATQETRWREAMVWKEWGVSFLFIYSFLSPSVSRRYGISPVLADDLDDIAYRYAFASGASACLLWRW